MPGAYACGVVPASADAVWSHIREFNSLSKRHPAIRASELTSGTLAFRGTRNRTPSRWRAKEIRESARRPIGGASLESLTAGAYATIL
jgi:polyketide cyclase/dehydrase/lipid transport protein